MDVLVIAKLKKIPYGCKYPLDMKDYAYKRAL